MRQHPTIPGIVGFVRASGDSGRDMVELLGVRGLCSLCPHDVKGGGCNSIPNTAEDCKSAEYWMPVESAVLLRLHGFGEKS